MTWSMDAVLCYAALYATLCYAVLCCAMRGGPLLHDDARLPSAAAHGGRGRVRAARLTPRTNAVPQRRIGCGKRRMRCRNAVTGSASCGCSTTRRALRRSAPTACTASRTTSTPRTPTGARALIIGPGAAIAERPTVLLHAQIPRRPRRVLQRRRLPPAPACPRARQSRPANALPVPLFLSGASPCCIRCASRGPSRSRSPPTHRGHARASRQARRARRPPSARIKRPPIIRRCGRSASRRHRSGAPPRRGMRWEQPHPRA